MAKQDRKQRLRSLQQTAQLQTGGLPGISSYQPKAATQGKSNEAQMANALAQLAPSLTEFLGTKFQSDKKAGIAKGRQKFFHQDSHNQPLPHLQWTYCRQSFFLPWRIHQKHCPRIHTQSLCRH